MQRKYYFKNAGNVTTRNFKKDKREKSKDCNKERKQEKKRISDANKKYHELKIMDMITQRKLEEKNGIVVVRNKCIKKQYIQAKTQKINIGKEMRC